MPLCRRSIVWLPGETETAKSAVTTRVTVVVLPTCPLLPVIVIGYVPAGAEKLVATLSVVEPEVFKVEE